ncbi:MAG: 3-dehydroquinate synthase family protein [Planctomycetota bacterium]
MSEPFTLRCAPAGWRPSSLHFAGFANSDLRVLRDAVAAGRVVHAVLDAGALDLWPGLRAFLDDRALVLPGGESAKSFARLEQVLEHWTSNGVERGHVAFAIGGGAITDLVGLAAALCLRGIDFVSIPTTLLAMVDASVGGKTAIDLRSGKNLAGAFWPASQVWIDAGFTKTETDQHYRAGLAEVVKVGLGLDPALFEHCEATRHALAAREPESLRVAIRLAVARKVAVVERDPAERDLRRLLNLGHTYGHALEAWHRGRVPHGLCVAEGLRWIVALAERRSVLTGAAAARVLDLLDAVGLAAVESPGPSALLPFVARDKKVVGGRIQVVLPTAIGASTLVSMDPREFLDLDASG